MHICVLSASPKGSYSITYQTVRYLALRFPEDSFEVLHVGARIRAAEKDFAPFCEAMQKADLLLFCYPVYTFMAPYQLHRFIELMKAHGVSLAGKYAAQITTSKHFYDVTAHAYVRENAEDLGLLYLGGLSADMDDLLCERGRAEAEAFWKLVHFRAENGLYEVPAVRSAEEPKAYLPLGKKTEKREGQQIVIVANLAEGDTALASMIEDFRDRYPAKSRVVNLCEYPFKGGCLGCFGCATSGKCVYKDGFDDFLRNEIQTADAIVYAFRVQDHSMGARMKLYDDRQFCNGHRTVTAGMPMGYLVAGDLSAEENLRTVIHGRSEVGGNFLCGIATDAAGVDALAATLEYALKEKLTQPSNFLGVGGMKIFRDLIYLMQGMMKADHKFYKAHGLYKDFPQKKKGTILKMKLVGTLISNPKIKKKMGNKMNEGMLMPYNKIFKKLEEENKSK
jgi:multimeric flavodoxin WrbA